MIEVHLLRPNDELKGFCSGNPDLDRFFIRYAGQNQFRHHIGTTHVAIEDDIIKGFVAYQRFVVEQFYNRLIGLPLYYTAQFLLAFSVGLVKRPGTEKSKSLRVKH